MVELKQLQLLDAVERLGTVTAAARELGYSQPALTHQLQSMEREFGRPLVARVSRGMQLTDAGHILLRHGRVALAEVSEAERQISKLDQHSGNEIRMAAFPSATLSFLPRILADRSGAPFNIRVFHRDPADAITALEREECEIALIFEYFFEERAVHPLRINRDVLRTRIAVEQVMVALPETTPTPASPLKLADLREQLWVAGCPVCTENLRHVCASAGFQPKITLQVDDCQTQKNLVAAGVGAALLTDLMVGAGELEHVQLLALQQAARRVSALTRPKSRRHPEVARALATLAELGQAGELTGSHTFDET